MTRAALVLALAGLVAPARAVETTQVLNMSASAGQYFFERQRGSFSGNAALVYAPLLKFNSRWSLLPMYSGRYQGTKGVDDGVAAGTLFQQQMDHRVSATGLRSLEGTNWRVKPTLSYKRQFLNETRNESWGSGLFDYEKIAAGVEFENAYKDPFVFRAGLDAWRVRFPNYESLESRSGADPLGNPLGRELAPKHVLDTYNWQASVSGSRPWPAENPKVVLQGGYSFLYQDYLDQKLVDASGQFVNDGRRDFAQTLYGSVGKPFPTRAFDQDARLDLGFNTTLAYNRSNQSTYDATFAQYVPNSYSYWSLGVGPNANLAWGDMKAPNWLSASLRWTRQNYLGRLVQDGDGVYSGTKQRQDRWNFSLGWGVPIAPKFTLTTKADFLWAASNHKFEKNYKYTYRAVSYQLGVSYEY